VRTGTDTPSEIFLDDGLSNRTPAVSPDGRWVAYGSDESGQSEIYVRPFPGPGGRHPVSVSGGTQPVWTRDGRGLVYKSDPSTWMLATVREDADFLVEDRRVFVVIGSVLTGDERGLEYSISLDGERLLLNRTMEQGVGASLVLIHNWGLELRERAGSN
jgi:hypothetical protein